MPAPMPMPGGLPAPSAPEDGMPPMGESPASAPSDNAGAEMQGMQGAALIVDAAAELLPRIGAASEMGQLLLDFIKKASKIVQPGAVSPAGKQNQLDEMQRNNMQNGQNMSMMRQQSAQQQPPQQSQPGA